MSTFFNNIRLFSEQTPAEGTQAPKLVKAPWENNASLWNADINKKPEEDQKLATSFVAKFLNNSGFSLFDRDSSTDKKDGMLSDFQKAFLLENQYETKEVITEQGQKVVGLTKQSAPDTNITKGEMENLIKLKVSLEKNENLTKEEKNFLKNFNEVFGKAGESGTLNFKSDYSTAVQQEVYQEYDNSKKIGNINNEAKKIIANPSDEKEQVVQLTTGEQVLMSEKDMNANIGKDYKAIGTKTIERNYTVSDSKYPDVNTYIQGVKTEKQIQQKSDEKINDPFRKTRLVSDNEFNSFANNQYFSEFTEKYEAPVKKINPTNGEEYFVKPKGNGTLRALFDAAIMMEGNRSPIASIIQKESANPKNLLGHPFADNTPSSLVQGICLEQNGDYNKALICFKNSLEKITSEEDKTKVLNKIKELEEKTSFPVLSQNEVFYNR